MSNQQSFEGMPEKLFACTPYRLETWLDCPKKYRYTYIDTPKPPRGGPWGTPVWVALYITRYESGSPLLPS